VNDVEEFWDVLRDGVETIGDYPGGRLPHIDAVYSNRDGIATHRGGFLAGIDQFDAEFFGVSPREAALLDPQQRLLLEVAWEAVEDAGIPASKIAGSQTGVFVGLWTSDYEACLYEQTEGLDFYATTGSGRYSASGRLAFFFDLRGPNLTLDTACSSSLVAIHLACQSLRLGESEMALAGGANVILRPEITAAYSAAKMLSPDGRSKFGDASANGYVRSEGAGMILLKTLSRAVADGDPIYAVIRGSAVNNDGRASGMLIAPSREGQEAVLRSAFRSAGVDGGALDYIEAHGTGTPVGDLVEVETIGRVVDTSERKRPCFIGSVKTNIGHTEAAAGTAGVIKVALSLQRGTIPASLHLREPNPSIAWNRFPISLQTATGPWPHTDQMRLAGVSGFGITGTNAHLVMENFVTPHPEPAGGRRNHLFLLSGHSDEARKAMAGSWLERLQSDAAWPESLASLAYTASVRRSHHDFRLAIVAASRRQLEDKLTQWIKGEQAERVRTGRKLLLEAPKTVFVFAGHGAQWAGMARGLFDEPVFYDTLAKCDEFIRKFAGWSVIERLQAGEMPDDACIAQPSLFAVMVSLAALWRSWGIEPQAVVGHSMGECAAAVVCGALSLEDGAAVICARSHLMKRVSGKGSMVFAALSIDNAAALALEYNGRISVAVNNSPGSTVLSGDTDAIEEVIRRLNEREIFCRRVRVDVASHSSQMDPLLAELKESIGGIRPRAASIPFYSTTTGRQEDGTALDPEYWSRNLRHPVLFSSTVESLLRDGFNTFVEVSSHPLLIQSIEEHVARSGKQVIAVPSLRRDGDDPAEMLNSLGALFVAGFPVDFGRLYSEGVCLRLPAYPWQRERHWIAANSEARHPRRVTATPSPAPEDTNDLYELHWSESEPPAAPSSAGLWIIVSGENDIASLVARGLEGAGNQCLPVSSVEELARALDAVGGQCRGVIRISATHGTDPRHASTEAFDIIQTVRASALAANPPRLWLLSTQVWRLPGDTGEVCAAQSPAWGLGRVIEREHPELRCANVDLSASPGPTDIENLLRLLCHNGSEEQIALRAGKYFVARYEPVPNEKNLTLPAFRSDATYLITGGLGGIGLHVADWLVQNGARNLALVSRRPPDDSARERITALESGGAAVRVFSADVADDEQVRSLLAAIHAELPPLKGVFHLAVANHAALLSNPDASGLESVMRSKAVAAWTLDRHLNGVELDFFVLFSSIAAALSQPGMANYAAANAYVEGLARCRRARGLKAQSIQWAGWQSTGLGSVQKGRNAVRTYQEMGIQSFPVERALRLLGRIITLEATGVLAASVSWEVFARHFENAAPPCVFQRLLPKQQTAPPSAAPECMSDQLHRIEAGGRRSVLETHLQKTLAAVLKTDPGRIDPAKPFGAMGVDSLMGLELVRRLSVTTSLRLPATMVFNYPTIQTLALEIARRMGIPLTDATPATSAQTGSGASVETSAVASLTEEQAIEALMGEGGHTP
jgi:acyl transferase domain-containing protein/acyl carrier protein